MDIKKTQKKNNRKNNNKYFEVVLLKIFIIYTNLKTHDY